MAVIRFVFLWEKEYFQSTNNLQQLYIEIKENALIAIKLLHHLKVAEVEKLGLASLLELAEKSGNIQLEAALESRVTDECLSIFNVDGSMRKTCKSKLLEFFDLDPVVRNPHNYVGLVDMGLIWRLVTPTPEDREAKKWDG